MTITMHSDYIFAGELTATALYAYEAQDDTQISFAVGDIIKVRIFFSLSRARRRNRKGERIY